MSVFEWWDENKTGAALLFVSMFKPPFSQEAGGNAWWSGLQGDCTLRLHHCLLASSYIRHKIFNFFLVL